MILGCKAANNAAGDGAPDEDKGESTDNDVDDKDPGEVILEIVGCITDLTHL